MHTYMFWLNPFPPFPPFQLLLTPFPSHPFSCSHSPPWVHLVLLVCLGMGPSTGLWVATSLMKTDSSPSPIAISCQSFSVMGGTSWCPAHPCWVWLAWCCADLVPQPVSVSLGCLPLHSLKCLPPRPLFILSDTFAASGNVKCRLGDCRRASKPATVYPVYQLLCELVM